MRDAFVKKLTEKAADDPSIMLLVGDLGFGVVADFGETYPRQFLNCGVAEQSMVGIAAGMASAGRRPFVYSIANFPTLRPLEQIRNDVCYHGLGVTIVSVGAGLAYGSLGYTHHAVEDISILRSLPGMRVYSPADAMECRAAVDEILADPSPAYLRLGKNKEPLMHAEPPDLSTGEPIVVREGTDVTVLVAGPIIVQAVEVAENLAEAGVSVRVVSCPVIKPLNAEAVRAAADGTVGIVTLEEHTRDGRLRQRGARGVRRPGLAHADPPARPGGQCHAHHRRAGVAARAGRARHAVRPEARRRVRGRSRMTAYETLRYEVADEILTLWLSRPEQLNAFTVTMANELVAAFDRASADDDVAAIVVTGEGRAFCAGMDLSSEGNVFGLDETQQPTMADLTDRFDDPAIVDGVRDTGGRVSLAIYRCTKPVIAAINGAAVGIGATMTLPMDVRIASEKARIGFVFGRLGIVPEACSTWFLPRIVGISRALELVYSADILDARAGPGRGPRPRGRAGGRSPPDRVRARPPLRRRPLPGGDGAHAADDVPQRRPARPGRRAPGGVTGDVLREHRRRQGGRGGVPGEACRPSSAARASTDMPPFYPW